MSRSGAGRGRHSLSEGLTVIPMLCAALPVLWLLYCSFRYSRYVIGSNPLSSPTSLTLGNYTTAFDAGSILPHELFNSVLITVGAIAICLTVGTLAGYSLSKLGWSRRVTFAVLGLAVLIQLMPPVTLLPGLYVTLDRLGLLGSVAGLVLANSVMQVPFATVLMKIYFDVIPKELSEAAAADGATELTIFRRVILPVASPGLATAAILVGIFVWNEFLMGLTLSSGTAGAPVTVGIAGLLQPYSIQFGPMAAAASVFAH